MSEIRIQKSPVACNAFFAGPTANACRSFFRTAAVRQTKHVETKYPNSSNSLEGPVSTSSTTNEVRQTRAPKVHLLVDFLEEAW